MTPFRWSPAKNGMILRERGVTFEEVTVAVESGRILDVVAHPTPRKHPAQRNLVVDVANCACWVPFIDEADHFFLKTTIPSRKATRAELTREADDART